MNKTIDLELLKLEIERRTGLKDIGRKTNKRPYAYARALFYHLALTDNKSKFSLDAIGAFVGKDHCAVLHAKKMMPVYLTDKMFKELYYSFNSEDFIGELNEAEQEIKALKKRILVLQDQLNSREGVKLKSTHRPLLEIINNIPAYHIELVKARLDPIVKMLEKPSRHNYLPQN